MHLLHHFLSDFGRQRFVGFMLLHAFIHLIIVEIDALRKHASPLDARRLRNA